MLCDMNAHIRAGQVAALALKLIDIRILKQDLEIIIGVLFGLDKEIGLREHKRDKNGAHFEVANAFERMSGKK